MISPLLNHGRFSHCSRDVVNPSLAFGILLWVAIVEIADAGFIVHHKGSANPLSEGFVNQQNSGEILTTPVSNDLGFDAWSIDSEGGGTFDYHHELSESERAEAYSWGWRITMTLRIVNVPDEVDFGVSAGVLAGHPIPYRRLFLFEFGAQSDGDPIIRLATDSTPIEVAVEGGGAGYHTYQISYNPASEFALLRVDGVPRRGWSGCSYRFSETSDQVSFGVFGESGHANWNEFTFESLQYFYQRLELTIERQDEAIAVSWPLDDDGYRLETAAGIFGGPTDWQVVPGATQIRTNPRIVIPLLEERTRLFRLIKN